MSMPYLGWENVKTDMKEFTMPKNQVCFSLVHYLCHFHSAQRHIGLLDIIVTIWHCRAINCVPCNIYEHSFAVSTIVFVKLNLRFCTQYILLGFTSRSEGKQEFTLQPGCPFQGSLIRRTSLTIHILALM